MTWLRKKATQADCPACKGVGRGPGGEGTTCPDCDGAGQVGGPSQHGNPSDSPLDQMFVNREKQAEAKPKTPDERAQELYHKNFKDLPDDGEEQDHIMTSKFGDEEEPAKKADALPEDNPADEEPQDGPSPEDYMITDSGPLGSRYSVGQVEGKHLGEFDSWDAAVAAINAKMEQDQFWPGAWYQDDHGGIQPASLDLGGE